MFAEEVVPYIKDQYGKNQATACNVIVTEKQDGVACFMVACVRGSRPINTVAGYRWNTGPDHEGPTTVVIDENELTKPDNWNFDVAMQAFVHPMCVWKKRQLRDGSDVYVNVSLFSPKHRENKRDYAIHLPHFMEHDMIEFVLKRVNADDKALTKIQRDPKTVFSVGYRAELVRSTGPEHANAWLRRHKSLRLTERVNFILPQKKFAKYLYKHSTATNESEVDNEKAFALQQYLLRLQYGCSDTDLTMKLVFLDEVTALKLNKMQHTFGTNLKHDSMVFKHLFEQESDYIKRIEKLKSVPRTDMCECVTIIAVDRDVQDMTDEQSKDWSEKINESIDKGAINHDLEGLVCVLQFVEEEGAQWSYTHEMFKLKRFVALTFLSHCAWQQFYLQDDSDRGTESEEGGFEIAAQRVLDQGYSFAIPYIFSGLHFMSTENKLVKLETTSEEDPKYADMCFRVSRWGVYKDFNKGLDETELPQDDPDWQSRQGMLFLWAQYLNKARVRLNMKPIDASKLQGTNRIRKHIDSRGSEFWDGRQYLRDRSEKEEYDRSILTDIFRIQWLFRQLEQDTAKNFAQSGRVLRQMLKNHRMNQENPFSDGIEEFVNIFEGKNTDDLWCPYAEWTPYPLTYALHTTRTPLSDWFASKTKVMCYPLKHSNLIDEDNSNIKKWASRKRIQGQKSKGKKIDINDNINDSLLRYGNPYKQVRFKEAKGTYEDVTMLWPPYLEASSDVFLMKVFFQEKIQELKRESKAQRDEDELKLLVDKKGQHTQRTRAFYQSTRIHYNPSLSLLYEWTSDNTDLHSEAEPSGCAGCRAKLKSVFKKTQLTEQKNDEKIKSQFENLFDNMAKALCDVRASVANHSEFETQINLLSSEARELCENQFKDDTTTWEAYCKFPNEQPLASDHALQLWNKANLWLSKEFRLMCNATLIRNCMVALTTTYARKNFFELEVEIPRLDFDRWENQYSSNFKKGGELKRPLTMDKPGKTSKTEEEKRYSCGRWENQFQLVLQELGWTPREKNNLIESTCFWGNREDQKPAFPRHKAIIRLPEIPEIPDAPNIDWSFCMRRAWPTSTGTLFGNVLSTTNSELIVNGKNEKYQNKLMHDSKFVEYEKPKWSSEEEIGEDKKKIMFNSWYRGIRDSKSKTLAKLGLGRDLQDDSKEKSDSNNKSSKNQENEEDSIPADEDAKDNDNDDDNFDFETFEEEGETIHPADEALTAQSLRLLPSSFDDSDDDDDAPLILRAKTRGRKRAQDIESGSESDDSSAGPGDRDVNSSCAPSTRPKIPVFASPRELFSIIAAVVLTGDNDRFSFLEQVRHASAEEIYAEIKNNRSLMKLLSSY